MPTMEITTCVGCRVQCTFCPQDLLMTRYERKTDENKITFAKPVMMSFNTFKTCIDKIPLRVEINFSGFTEAFLNPNCVDMILYAHERGHKINVFSTLVGMTEEDVEKIKHIKFGTFVIHLPDANHYAKIAINDQYIRVIKKIISGKIHHLHCMCMGEIPSVIQEITGLNFPPAPMHDRAGNNEIGFKTPKKYGPLLCTKASDCGIKVIDENVLLPNGDVCLCCMDYGMEYVLGNLLRQGYDSLFTSDEFKKVKEKMSEQDSDIMCRVCTRSISADKIQNISERKSKTSKRKFNDEYSLFIGELYEEVLYRQPREVEMDHFHTMLESKTMTFEQVRKQLEECDERKQIQRPRLV